MSLRARLIALVGAVLLVSLLSALVVTAFQVRAALDEELAAGLSGARQTVQSAFEDLPRSDHPDRDLRQTVDTFNGNRHVQAILIDSRGGVAWASRTNWPARPAPWWFQRLFGPARHAVGVAIPAGVNRYRQITLTPIAELDVAAVWREFAGVLIVLTVCGSSGLLLVAVVISRAFRPLTLLAAQFDRVAAGNYAARVAVGGPRELLRLQHGFNHMGSKLAATTDRNRLLNEQILNLQEEERADIARDLHDEIGPYLFAVNVDAAMISQFCETGRHSDIPAQARAIQSSVSHMQREVRDLLGRLRPARVTEFGLHVAVRDLVTFWSARRPEIDFKIAFDDDLSTLAEATAEVAYRVAQEGVNNAVRHGNPTFIRIEFAAEQNHVVVCIADDGSGAASPSNSGLGLIGMTERVASIGGTTSYGPNATGRGWTTTARLRLATAEPASPIAGAR